MLLSFACLTYPEFSLTWWTSQAQLRALEARCSQLLELDVHQQCQVQSEREYCRLVLPYALDRPTQDSWEALALMDDVFDADLLSPSFGGARGGGRGGGRLGGGAAAVGGGMGVGGTRYPKTFAFSALVPKLALELHRVVVFCLLFSLQLQLPAMEGTLVQVSRLGRRVLSACRTRWPTKH